MSSSLNLPDLPSKTLEALLERTSLPYLTSGEQFRLALISDCMMEVDALMTLAHLV
jgi:hypothetical protein